MVQSVNNGAISRKIVAIYGAINFGAVIYCFKNGAILWRHNMVPFNGAILWHVCTRLYGHDTRAILWRDKIASFLKQFIAPKFTAPKIAIVLREITPIFTDYIE